MYWNDPYIYRWLGAVLIGALCIIGITISVVRIRRHNKKVLYLIPAYFFLILSQLVSTEYLLALNVGGTGKRNIINICLALYIPLEVILLSGILYYSILSKLVKKYLIYAPLGFSLLAIISWWNFSSWNKFLAFISTTESIILFVPSVYYFFEILKSPPTLTLNKEPSFWTSTGILFLIISFTPFYLSYNSISPFTRQVLDYLGYTLIILLFIKASTCTPKTTMQKYQ